MYSCHIPPSLVLLVFLVSACSLLPFVFTYDGEKISSNSSDLNSSWMAKLAFSANRAYGSLIPPAPSDHFWKPLTDHDRLLLREPKNGTCGVSVALDVDGHYDFIITPTVKFCAVLVQSVDDSSAVRVDTTEVDLGPCDEEYLHLTKPDQSSLTVCGGRSPLTFSDARYLILQYERRAPTPTAFTVRAWAEKILPAFTGREISADANQTEGVQICPDVCGQPLRHSRTRRVLGGTAARPGEFPWMVQLYSIRNSGREGIPPTVKMCGGSILDRRHILTAAHCIMDPVTRVGPDTLDVIVGTNSPASVLRTQPDPSAVSARVDRWFLTFPPHIWRLWSDPYDIAVVRLRAELPFNDRIAPVCLAPHQDYTHSDVTVTGYGDRENETAAATLHKMQLTIRPNSECQEEYIRLLPGHSLSSHEICMFAPGKDNCAGDSGGPAIIRRNGRLYQVGVISYGFPCNSTKNDTTHHGVYTRVSSFLPWIRHIIGRNATCS